MPFKFDYTKPREAEEKRHKTFLRERAPQGDIVIATYPGPDLARMLEIMPWYMQPKGRAISFYTVNSEGDCEYLKYLNASYISLAETLGWELELQTGKEYAPSERPLIGIAKRTS